MNDKNAHKKWPKQRKRQLETETNTSQLENRKKQNRGENGQICVNTRKMKMSGVRKLDTMK